MMRDQRLVEVGTGDILGRVSYKFALTEGGRVRAREAVENCRYVGPAPVSLAQYREQCTVQQVTGTRCHPTALRAAFKEYVIRPALLGELGPAVCSGKSLFLYGPPGNGKTVIAKGLGRFLSMFCGEIYVPYAILAENNIITFFDPGIHQTTDDAEQGLRGRTVATVDSAEGVSEGPVDRRWRRIKRPVVVTGSELTLDLLELKYNKLANYYNAPLHIKANGGMFLIDDIGRQAIRAKDLLNRWTVPLEEGADYLTLSTGTQMHVAARTTDRFRHQLRSERDCRRGVPPPDQAQAPDQFAHKGTLHSDIPDGLPPTGYRLRRIGREHSVPELLRSRPSPPRQRPPRPAGNGSFHLSIPRTPRHTDERSDRRMCQKLLRHNVTRPLATATLTAKTRAGCDELQFDLKIKSRW